MKSAAAAFVISLSTLSVGACHHDPPPDPAKVEGVGAPIPQGTLTTVNNTQVATADVFGAHAKTIVVFYRGYF
jgi:hypothetical protein